MNLYFKLGGDELYTMMEIYIIMKVMSKITMLEEVNIEVFQIKFSWK